MNDQQKGTSSEERKKEIPITNTARCVVSSFIMSTLRSRQPRQSSVGDKKKKSNRKGGGGNNVNNNNTDISYHSPNNNNNNNNTSRIITSDNTIFIGKG